MNLSLTTELKKSTTKRKTHQGARIDARCKVELPVEFQLNAGEQSKNIRARTANISLGGAFIKTNITVPVRSTLKLNTTFYNETNFCFHGKVVWKNKKGFALQFETINDSSRKYLWKIISNNLKDSLHCPFCGMIKTRKSKRCEKCFRSLDFTEDQAFTIYSKEVHTHCFDSINWATEYFNHTLETIEKKYLAGRINKNSLLKETLYAVREICSYCRTIETLLVNDCDLLHKMRQEFIEKTNRFMTKSYLVRWARTWPQGYPGDFKIIEDIYRNVPKSIGLGYLLDENFLNNALAYGVRGRKELLKKILLKEITNRKTLNILSVACGSCRDLFEIASELESSQAMITGIDLDSEALDFAADRFTHTGLKSNLILRKYNAIRMLSHEKNMREFGPQDIIYTLGLFDYVRDETLVRLMNSLYDLLNPQGKFICAFPNSEKYNIEEFNWIVDWPIIHRTKNDSAALFKKTSIPSRAVQVKTDRSGVIVFYIVTKD